MTIRQRREHHRARRLSVAALTFLSTAFAAKELDAGLDAGGRGGQLRSTGRSSPPGRAGYDGSDWSTILPSLGSA